MCTSSQFLPETKLTAASPRPTVLLEAMRLMKKTSSSTSKQYSSSRATKRRRISQAQPQEENEMRKVAKQRRSVHFAAASPCSGTIPALFHVLTLQHIQELWYSSHDIQTFKAQVKHLLSSRPREVAEKEADASGLERFTLERTWRKKRTIHAVVQASSLQQRQRRDSLDLSQGSHKSQRTHHGGRTTARLLLPLPQEYESHAFASQRRAIQQGFRDFCQVYDPLSSLFGDDDKTNYNELFFSGDQNEKEESVGVAGVSITIQLPVLSPSNSSANLVRHSNRPQLVENDPILQRLQQVREQQKLIQLQIDANTRAILRHDKEVRQQPPPTPVDCSNTRLI